MTGSAPTVTPTAAIDIANDGSSAAAKGASDDVAMDGGQGGEAAGSSPQQDQQFRNGSETAQMDYDVTDENDWGME